MEPQIVAAVIGPVCTAMLAALGIAMKAVHAQRRSTSSREREMQAASQKVEFIASYLAALERLPSGSTRRDDLRARADDDLEAAYRTMMAVSRVQQKEGEGVDWRAVLDRALLIPVHRDSARLVRAFYYLVLGYALFSSAVYVSLVFSDEMREQGLVITIMTVLFLVAANLVPLWLMRLWVHRLDGPSRSGRIAPAELSFSWPEPTGSPAALPIRAGGSSETGPPESS